MGRNTRGKGGAGVQDLKASGLDCPPAPIFGGPLHAEHPQRRLRFQPRCFRSSALISPCEVPNPSFSCLGQRRQGLIPRTGINNFDMSAFKNMLFGERWRAQLRDQSYNALNHTQFTTVNASATYSTAGVQTNGLFGQYTAAANPRQLQLALRVTF